MKHILIIGANSAIAEACARTWASRGDALYLVARNEDKLQRLKQDLKARGAPEINTHVLDINQVHHQAEMLTEVLAHWPKIDISLLAHGTLPDQQVCEHNLPEMLNQLQTNAVSTLSLLHLLANHFEKQQAGTIATITSVAGDRGRQSNYLYGSAKAMVSHFLQGLRQRLSKKDVSVLDIKPGFVDTPMTTHYEKGLLWAQPQQVATKIVSAIDQGKTTVYTPGFWYWIMLIIRNIPESLFMRLKL